MAKKETYPTHEKVFTNPLIQKEIKVRITFTDPILGSQPNDELIYRTFIATKAPDAQSIEEEVAAIGVNEVEEKGTTVFHQLPDGTNCLRFHQVEGFFKEACSDIGRVKATKSGELKAHKKVISGNVFVKPTMIPISTNENTKIFQRPLRAETAQGPRVSLASSVMVVEGATAEFTIGLLNPALEETVLEWLTFGELKGLGQWRNGGYGRFTYEIVSVA
jgi:hypothetical protein